MGPGHRVLGMEVLSMSVLGMGVLSMGVLSMVVLGKGVLSMGVLGKGALDIGEGWAPRGWGQGRSQRPGLPQAPS